MKNTAFLILIIICVSCGSEPTPKPRAFLRLEYPQPDYAKVNSNLPFSFEKNTFADNVTDIKIARDNKSIGINVTYPSLKGTIYLTYKKVEEENLEPYLLDAQNMTQKHTQKADAITEQPYIDNINKVYGMFYEVGGNAASQSQFYVTDSINHFVTGSLYFYTKPNYDSILPAAQYLKRDIQHLMESIKWNQLK
ncbi:MAG: gliding motility lipoprotein GldD [Bacteroidetes bacterium]|nr:MAG: gliding motility lipoprotein GldD [Bacteroidota bacterium]